MQKYRCACGDVEGLSTSPFYPCNGCTKCGTTLATSEELLQPLQHHTWIIKYNESTGNPYHVCKYCFQKQR